MAEQEDNLDIRLDELLGELRQRQDQALSRVDLKAQRRQIMRQIAAPAQRQLRPVVIRFAFGSVAAAAAAVLLVAGLQFLRPAIRVVTNEVATAALTNTQHTGGEAAVSLAAPPSESVAQAGSAKVDYPRMRYPRDGMPRQPQATLNQGPAGAVLMIGTARGRATEDLPYLE